MLQRSTTSKRKAPDDEPNANADGVMNRGSMTATSNPLINAAKKAKRESKSGASNKRKLANAEEAPGGLFIVRTQIPSSSLPPSTAAPVTNKPPAKKFKSSQPSHPQSQPVPRTSTRPPPTSRSSLLPPSQPDTLTRYNTPDADPALDAAVRAMDTEAADLRRSSRAPQTPNASGVGTSLNSFRLSSRSVSRPLSSGNGQEKRRRTERIIDMSAPLHAEEDETPQIQRNKRLRAGAMAAISSGDSERDADVDMAVDPVTPPRTPGQSAPGSTRRKSSVGRGKRISSSFQATGIITQPHNSVADASFYKHIDSDLPESERVRQLLIWCSARVASTLPSSSPSSSSTSPSDPPLPKLSAAAEAALKATQEDIVRRLAERRVDLSLFKGPGDANADTRTNNVILAENKQNVTNRTWEGVYSRDIRSAEGEEEAWKQVSSAFDAYARRTRSAIEQRRANLVTLAPSTSMPTPASVPGSESDSGADIGLLSAKAQGKQRAPSLELYEHDLLPSSRAGFRMARKVLARSRWRKVAGPEHLEETPDAGPSTSASASTGKGMDPDSRPLPTSSQGYGVDIDVDAGMEEDIARKEAEAARAAEKDLRQQMREVEFKLDHLYVMLSQARQTTEVAQMTLDARFEVLARALDARRAGSAGSGTALASTSASAAGKMPAFGRYIGAGMGAGAGGQGGSGVKDREEADEALALLRALARVDAARPPAQVGDAARRAVREAQRAGDANERRITEVPVGSGGVGLTPRKVPGTPRRGTTPGR